MNRLRTNAAMAAFVIIILGACSPAASGSVEPSGDESIAAVESQGGPEPSFSAGVVADLEALIPGTIGDATLEISSLRGNEYLISQEDDPLAVFLRDIGVSPSDVSMAIGIPADLSSGASMLVFRALGADPARLRQAFKDVSEADRDTPLVWNTATVGGKQVEVADYDGNTSYIYSKDDLLVIIGVRASDTDAAEEAIRGLP